MVTSVARRRGLLIVTSAFATMLLAANPATPLYAVFAKRSGFSTAQTSAAPPTLRDLVRGGT